MAYVVGCSLAHSLWHGHRLAYHLWHGHSLAWPQPGMAADWHGRSLPWPHPGMAAAWHGRSLAWPHDLWYGHMTYGMATASAWQTPAAGGAPDALSREVRVQQLALRGRRRPIRPLGVAGPPPPHRLHVVAEIGPRLAYDARLRRHASRARWRLRARGGGGRSPARPRSGFSASAPPALHTVRHGLARAWRARARHGSGPALPGV